jgi:hypothetical protein
MKSARIALLALACCLPLAASAQWLWLDKDGRKVFSDKAPPPEVAPDRILKQPGGRFAVPTAAAAAAAPAAPAASTALTVPAPSGTDKALAERRKQLQAAEADKKKAEEAKVVALRAENCSRAKSSKATFDSGVRLSVVNDKGEREIMNDAQRAAEVKRLDEVIARDCGH